MLKVRAVKSDHGLKLAEDIIVHSVNILLLNKKKQVDRKVLGQNKNFSTRLPYANKKIIDIYFSIVNMNFRRTEDMNNKLKHLETLVTITIR